MNEITNVRSVQGCLWEESEETEVSSLAERYLGKAGRILYFHRKIQHPATIFNASILTENGQRIWHGDIDVHRVKKELLNLSLKVGALYIHNEMPIDFRNRKMPLEEARASAAVMVEQGHILYSKKFMERMHELQAYMELRKKHKKQNTCERRFF